MGKRHSAAFVSLRLISNSRFCISVFWSMQFSTWLAHLHRRQGLWLLSDSLVCISPRPSLYISLLNCTAHGIAGWAAAPPAAIAGGTVDDLFSERERGLAMALYVTMPFAGAYA
jgi:hypothetical protein